MTTPEEAVRKYLKGIGVIPEEDPPQHQASELELEEDERWRKVSDFAKRLRSYLEMNGFEVTVYEYPLMLSATLDFYDPSVNEALERLGEQIQMDGWYATIQSKGSISIEAYGNKQVKVEGDIPLSMMRPRDVESGMFRQVLADGRPAQITELHFHMWDHRPAVHIHIEGVDVDPERLADFISKIRSISYRFATRKSPT